MSTQKIKYVNKELLRRINNVSTHFGYNRTLPDKIIDQLPDDKFYVVIPLLVHEHIAGKPADPHMRCRIYAGEMHPWLILDIEMVMYEFIPEHELETPENDDALTTSA